jgi:hypothetical protein
LTVASEVYPDHVAEANQRFGVADDAVRHELDETWVRRLRTEANLSQTFQQLLAQYRNWHKGRG